MATGAAMLGGGRCTSSHVIFILKRCHGSLGPSGEGPNLGMAVDPAHHLGSKNDSGPGSLNAQLLGASLPAASA